jgi:hypothetical protein
MLEQPGTELAQDREIEAGISQIESEQVFPVNPTSDSLGRLAVTQPAFLTLITAGAIGAVGSDVLLRDQCDGAASAVF